MSIDGGLFEEQEAQAAVARAVFALLPEGAERVLFQTANLTSVSNSSFGAYFEGGKKESIRVAGRFDSSVVRRLREVMYRPGTGTWFSMKMTVTADGAMDADFNYDTEPDFGLGGVDPVAYVNDAKTFPRDIEHQPEWLRLRLAEGEARINRSVR